MAASPTGGLPADPTGAHTAARCPVCGWPLTEDPPACPDEAPGWLCGQCGWDSDQPAPAPDADDPLR